MSQSDFNIANQTFPATRSEINTSLQALATNSSGASAPSTTYAYQFWVDTANNIFKQRDSANSAWLGRLGTGTNFDMYVGTVKRAALSVSSGNGIFSVFDTSNTETIKLNTNGDSYLNGGNFGVGASSPTALFQVVDSGGVNGSNSEVNGSVLIQGAASLATDRTGVLRVESNDGQGLGVGPSIGFAGRYIDSNNSRWTMGKISVFKDTSANGLPSGAMVFSTSIAAGSLIERMRIDSFGNVGVGTDSPSTLLHINNDTHGADVVLTMTAENDSGTEKDVTLTWDPDTEILTSSAAMDIGGNGTGLKFKVIDIGDWDMDTDGGLTIALGVARGNVRSVDVLIRNDTTTNVYPLIGRGATNAATVNQGDWALSSIGDDILLYRADSGFFDSTSFNATSFNRGWVTIWYVD